MHYKHESIDNNVVMKHLSFYNCTVQQYISDMLEGMRTNRGPCAYILGLPKAPGLLDECPKGDYSGYGC